MFVEEIVLEGFKSYASRTVISQWDPEFNAITGLNGSGKSNILDAICFVLGISNLSQVRAQNLQDLVYKRGQAGINKASVTIVFNNDDKKQSPVGFEQCEKITVTRQVIIGGRNKYLINGHVAQNQAIANLFQSVQLNINNPHFLIMQGRITKVLNMKPPEILAMIEEAAGTRMFEEKKDKAVKTIAKKDQKLAEITDIMENDIGPKLEKLKKEKADFLAFQKIEGEVERLRRLLIAYDYMRNKDKLDRSEADLNGKLNARDELEHRIDQLAVDMKDVQADVDTIMRRKEAELQKGSAYQELQKEVSELANQLTRLNTQRGLMVTSIGEEEKKVAEGEANVQQATNKAQESQSQADKLEVSFVKLKKAVSESTEKTKQQEELLQTLSTGISAKEGSGNGFVDQIEAAKTAKSHAVTEIERSKNRSAYLKEQLKSKEAKAKDAESENASSVKQIATLTKELERIRSQRASTNHDAAHEALLRRNKQEKYDEMVQTQEEIDNLRGQLSSVDFRYSDPYPGFDRKNVKGLVANLIKVDADKMEFTGALQVCAEGRLYYVVVEDNKVGSDLLKNGNLRRKCTIIPLKQILVPNVDSRRINKAKSLAPGRIEHALTLVGFPTEVEAAMRFVFGSTLICRDAEAAKSAAYNRDVNLRCITLDGDVYEPGATITGGSAPQSSDLLKRLSRMSELEEILAKLKQEYAQICAHLDHAQNEGAKVLKLEAEMRKLEHEMKSLQDVMNESSAGRLIQEVSQTRSELEEIDQNVADAKAIIKDSDLKVKELEAEMKEFTSNKDGKLKKIETELAKSKVKLAKDNEILKEKHREVVSTREDANQALADAKELEIQIICSKEAVQKMHDDLKSIDQEFKQVFQFHEEKNAKLVQQSRMYSQFDKDLKKLEDLRKKCTNESNECQLELKKVVHELERFHREKDTARDSVDRLLRDHEWIKDQEQNFGRVNTPFDFDTQNPVECRKRLGKLEQEYDELRKKINVKVMNMIDRVVNKERSLKQMLATVLKDKGKIEETIEQLEHYKKEALEKTWKQVNGDFGSIFNDLLPGNTAKLEPPESQTISEGLEVKVCLGGVWKQSLTELSGGQRSLVALSLILSLLQFKPAPMYILDEIDAALDLSHTQNIGHLFKSRFKGSQFIVVSLKEGMFNNANVLFKARFRDGTSVVERHVQSTSKVRDAGKENTATSRNVTSKRAGAATKRARRIPTDGADGAQA